MSEHRFLWTRLAYETVAMKADLAMASAHQKAEVRPRNPAPARHLPASIERRSPARQGSRGDKRRMSPAVIVRIVQAFDLLLLLFSGGLAKSMLTPLHWPPPMAHLFSRHVGSVVATVFLSRAGAYQLRLPFPLGKSLQILPLPMLVGGGSMIVCLFLMGDGSLVFRESAFPLAILQRSPAYRIARLSFTAAAPVDRVGQAGSQGSGDWRR